MNSSTKSLMTLAAEHFNLNARYGTLVATAFRDLHVPFHFRQ